MKWRGAGRGALAVLGLSPLWTILRDAPLPLGLYPSHFAQAGVPSYSPGEGLGASIVLLMLIAVTFVARGKLSRFADVHPLTTLVPAVLGSAGFWLSVSDGALPMPHWLACLMAALCISGCLLAAILCWGAYFSRRFGPVELVQVGLSFVASYALFSGIGIIAQLTSAEAALVVAPLVSAACWLVLGRGDVAACHLVGDQGLTPASLPKTRILADPFIASTASIIVIGAAVRGIVDPIVGDISVRWILSMLTTTALTLACIGFALGHMPGLRGNAGRGVSRDNKAPRVYASIRFDEKLPRFALCLWVALSVVLFLGLGVFFASDQKVGGDVVAVAQFELFMVLWMLLCHACARTEADAGGMLLVWFALPASAAALLRLAVVPAVLSSLTSLTPPLLIALLLLTVCGVVVLAFGCRAVLGGAGASTADGARRVIDAAGPSPVSAPPGSAAGALDIEAIIPVYRLTEREAEAARLYARGFTIKKVADCMGVSVPTAQSHMRSVYRKLDVHTKNDFIERLARGR